MDHPLFSDCVMSWDGKSRNLESKEASSFYLPITPASSINQDKPLGTSHPLISNHIHMCRTVHVLTLLMFENCKEGLKSNLAKFSPLVTETLNPALINYFPKIRIIVNLFLKQVVIIPHTSSLAVISCQSS